MPYIQYLHCEQCGEGFALDIDPGATIKSYIEDGRKSAALNPATIVWDYLIYSCFNCKRTYKYTYRRVEERVRTYISSLAEKYKVYMEALDKYNDTEDKRLSGAFFVSDLEKKIKERYQSKN